MSTAKNRWFMAGLSLRKVGWGLAILLLIMPFAAMQLGVDGVHWSPGDFFFGALIFGVVGLLIELATRASTDAYFRAGVAVAVFAGLILVWSNLAVGILGNEKNDANLLFMLVPVIALAGSTLARFRPQGMAVTMTAAGAWLLAVPFVARAFAIGDAASPATRDYPLFLILFALMWFGAAGLLARAARGQPSS